MNAAEYLIYYRQKDGTRGEILNEFEAMTIVQKWTGLAKIQLSGHTTAEIPVKVGTALIVYRNAEFMFSGIIEEVSVSCSDIATEVKKWSASGEEDSMIFAWRYVFGDPSRISFSPSVKDIADGTTFERMIHYIDNCMGESALPERQIEDLKFPRNQKWGTEGKSAYQSKKLDSVLSEIQQTDGYKAMLKYDTKTGKPFVELVKQRDMREKIALSPQFSNITSWSSKTSLPTYNALWVVSGDYQVEEEVEGETVTYKKRLFAYADDPKSIVEFGRIEGIVKKAEMTPTDEGKGEEAGEDKITEEEAQEMLKAEAERLIFEKRSHTQYSITISETEDLKFMEDWKCGDMVSCTLEGEKFDSTIESVKIVYKNGVETVTPTVGKVETGIYGKVMETITSIEKELKEEEMNG